MTETALKKKIRLAMERAENATDQFQRTPEQEDRLNKTVQAALRGSDGDRFMDYLRSITVNVVLPPSASDAELRMQEGMRRLFGIIENRRSAK